MVVWIFLLHLCVCWLYGHLCWWRLKSITLVGPFLFRVFFIFWIDGKWCLIFPCDTSRKKRKRVSERVSEDPLNRLKRGESMGPNRRKRSRQQYILNFDLYLNANESFTHFLLNVPLPFTLYYILYIYMLESWYQFFILANMHNIDCLPFPTSMPFFAVRAVSHWIWNCNFYKFKKHSLFEPFRYK